MFNFIDTTISIYYDRDIERGGSTMSFGKRMQACREELGISQLALARQIGVSQSTIGNYECPLL